VSADVGDRLGIVERHLVIAAPVNAVRRAVQGCRLGLPFESRHVLCLLS
jgi:hypothetical protein